MKIIKVTNEDLYNDMVASVELSLTGNCGDVEIEMSDGSRRLFSGEHGQYDYEENYGFQIVPAGLFNKKKELKK
jgi:hypothetical protein